jgi:hypothetical protein
LYLQNPEPSESVLIWSRKGAEVADLNALKLGKTWGFGGQFYIKEVFLGQNKYIFGRSGGHMDI